jgi:hypothetical protein
MRRMKASTNPATAGDRSRGFIMFFLFSLSAGALPVCDEPVLSVINGARLGLILADALDLGHEIADCSAPSGI